MKKNVFFAGMVLAFGLVLMGCPPDDPPTTSISISGTTKVGETLTADFANANESNSTTAAASVEWHYYSDAACTVAAGGSGYGGGGTPWVIPASAEGKWIRASIYGQVEPYEYGDVYSNILGPVVAADLNPLTDVTLTPATANVTKGNTQAFVLKFKQGANFNSSNITWSVVGATAASTTITGSGVSMDGTYTVQNRTLTVAAGENATTLTVKVVYGTQEWTATVTVN